MPRWFKGIFLKGYWSLWELQILKYPSRSSGLCLTAKTELVCPFGSGDGRLGILDYGPSFASFFERVQRYQATEICDDLCEGLGHVGFRETVASTGHVMCCGKAAAALHPCCFRLSGVPTLCGRADETQEAGKLDVEAS